MLGFRFERAGHLMHIDFLLPEQQRHRLAFDIDATKAEDAFVECARRVDRMNGQYEMVDSVDHAASARKKEMRGPVLWLA